MKISPPVESIVFKGKLNIALFFLLVLVGLAGNYFKYQIFFNVDFIFGSIFAMLALQFFGILWGIIAAVVISSFTFVLWLHPYAIIIMTCEVIFVAFMTGKKKTGFVMADSLYWIVLGMPLVLLFYHGVMKIPMSNTFIIMLKQSVNGIFNAILARLIFSLVAIYRREALITFRETVFNLLAFLVLMVSLVTLFVESRKDFARTDSEIRSSITITGRRVTTALQRWLDLKTSSMMQLAKLAGTLPVAAMQERIEQSLASDPDFLRMGMTDPFATTIAYSPVYDDMGKRNIGKNFADRPYIPILKSAMKPMLSEVVMGRIGTPKPFTSILVPIVKNGDYHGYVIGVINFDRIRELLAENVEGSGMQFILLDKNRNIIVTSYANRKSMMLFTRSGGATKQLDEKVSQWVPDVQGSGTSIMERWRNSYYIVSSQIGKVSEWELVLEQPIAPFQKSLNDEYSDKLMVAFSIFIIALIFAEFSSRKILYSTERLQEITTALPSKLRGGGATEWPWSAMAETNRLIGNFMDMEEALKQKFHELEWINEGLENKVKLRTAELNSEMEEHKKTAQNLRESEEKYRVIFQNDIYAICIFDMETMRFIDMNDAHVGMYGYTREEFLSGMTIYDITAEHNDSEKTIQELIREGSIFIPLRYHRRKDGARFPVEIVGGSFTWQGKGVIFAMTHDISGRTNAEDSLQEKTRLLEDLTKNLENKVDLEISRRMRNEQILIQQSKLATMGEMLGAIAHQWRQPLNALGLSIQNMRETFSHGELDRPMIEEMVKMSMGHIRHMSKTIDDFRNFFLPDKGKTEFDAMVAVGEVLSLLSAQLAANKIDYRLTCLYHKKVFKDIKNITPCEEKVVEGFRNEFEHVIMNVIDNAIDSILERLNRNEMADERGSINFVFDNRDDWIVITISDNGRGIPDTIFDRVFEPYFTTKEQSRGTGIGLYMAKIIIEDHMAGRISARKSDKGAIMVIELPAAAARHA